MLLRSNRREFLEELRRGALVLGLGVGLNRELAWALPFVDEDGPLVFGELEPLVALMQETAPDELLPILVRKLTSGTELRTLVGAAALANARTFGGEDYEGYHAAMALAPAFDMGSELADNERALPVLKVIYRNTERMQRFGGRPEERLHHVQPADEGDADTIRRAVLAGDVATAEAAFLHSARGGVEAGYAALQPTLLQDIEVHRVVLAWRTFDTLRFAGAENAQTLMRQSVRFCVDQEERRKQNGIPEPTLRSLIPKLLEEHGLLEGATGRKSADDAQIEEWARVFFAGSREDAAACAAAALGEGFAGEDVGRALSLAANQLLLDDPGRPDDRAYGCLKGSVHGASVGVHASDSARAWRNIAATVGPRYAAANWIGGAYHAGGQSSWTVPDSFPYREASSELEGQDARELLHALQTALTENDQARACATVDACEQAGAPPESVFAVLRRTGVEADGALHAEKYYRTVREDFTAARPAHRWRHLVGLARVTASEAGAPAPGLEAARELLDV